MIRCKILKTDEYKDLIEFKDVYVEEFHPNGIPKISYVASDIEIIETKSHNALRETCKLAGIEPNDQLYITTMMAMDLLAERERDEDKDEDRDELTKE